MIREQQERLAALEYERKAKQELEKKRREEEQQMHAEMEERRKRVWIPVPVFGMLVVHSSRG